MRDGLSALCAAGRPCAPHAEQALLRRDRRGSHAAAAQAARVAEGGVRATAQHTAAAFAGQAGVFGGGLLSLCQKVLVRPIWDDDEGSMS